MARARPRAEIDIATALQVPGLRTMLAQTLAHTERRENIQNGFSAMAAAVKAEDVVFLYFAGHGKVTRGEEMFYFVPADGHAANRRQTSVNTG